MSTNSTPRDLIFDSLMKGSLWEKALFWKGDFVQNPIGSFSSFFLTIKKTLIKYLDFVNVANSCQKSIKKSLIFFSIYIFCISVFHGFSFSHENYRHTSATSLFQCFFVVFVNIPLGHHSLYQYLWGETTFFLTFNQNQHF